MFYKTILFVHDALGALFIPKWESLANFGLWTNAMGQAFFNISVVAGVMIAYGSYLKSDSNIVSDSLIIAFSDLFVSILVSTQKGLKYQLSGHTYRQNNICFFLSSFAL